MWSLPETLMVILGGLLAAWGMSLVARAKPARRHRRHRCADCNLRLPPSSPACGALIEEGVRRGPASLTEGACDLADEPSDATRASRGPAPPASGDPPTAAPNPCPRCSSDTSRHHLAARTHPAWLTIPGLIAIALGLSCPWWSLPLLGILTGAAAPIEPTFGPMAAIAIALSGLALIMLVAGLFGDPSTGRPRCRKCWYPISATLPATCPECGRVATTTSHLYRTRRRRAPVALGLVVLLIAQVGWFDPYIRRHGLVSLVPTDLLISGIGIVPSNWIDNPQPPAATSFNPGMTFFTPGGTITTTTGGGTLIINGNTINIPGGAITFPGGTPGFFGPAPVPDPDYTLVGRIRDQKLSADQLRRVRAVAAARIPGSRSIREMQATLDLLALAATAPARPGQTGSPAPPSVAVNTWTLLPSLHSITADPEIVAAYADSVPVLVRELEESNQTAAEGLAWLLEHAANLVATEDRPLLASPHFAQSLSASAPRLRTLAGSSRDHSAAGALLLLAVSGHAGPSDLPRLAQLASCPDPVAANAADIAIGAIALEHQAARHFWLERHAPGTSVVGPGGPVGAFEPTAIRATRPAIFSPRVAFTLGAGWRAWVTSPAAANDLLTLNRSAQCSTWHQWAFVRSLSRADPAFAAALVEYALANPNLTKPIAVFSGLGALRFDHIERWMLLLDAERTIYSQYSVLDTLSSARKSHPQVVIDRCDQLAQYIAAVQRRLEADPAGEQDEHLRLALSRASELLDWIENQRR